mmetsp:Transcript_10800/g.45001  ORF Transcript_10800/g.45001 Transcript_10800/m.45001 type:complete len:87 (-) Transcript_10800:2019-2279(-)
MEPCVFELSVYTAALPSSVHVCLEHQNPFQSLQCLNSRVQTPERLHPVSHGADGLVLSELYGLEKLNRFFFRRFLCVYRGCFWSSV